MRFVDVTEQTSDYGLNGGWNSVVLGKSCSAGLQGKSHALRVRRERRRRRRRKTREMRESEFGVSAYDIITHL